MNVYQNNVPATWQNLQDNKDIVGFQDPFYESYIAREVFMKMYRPILETFDGRDMTSHVSFFFKRCVINDTMLVFADEDARLDFLDEAQELKIIPSTKEIQEGESTKDKEARNTKLKTYKEPQKRDKKRVPLAPAEKKEIMLGQMEQSVGMMRVQLLRENDPEKIHQLQIKIRKIICRELTM